MQGPRGRQSDRRDRPYGMRGLLDGVTFPYSARGKIRYLERIKASPQYRAAVEQQRQDRGTR